MHNDNCIFCKIANGKIQSKTIYEDKNFRAILDISPASKGHTLILPKSHFADISEMDIDLLEKLLPLSKNLAKKIQVALRADGFNILMNTGEAAGQTVFHQHTHIIPRYKDDKSFLTWNSLDSSEIDMDELVKKIKDIL